MVPAEPVPDATADSWASLFNVIRSPSNVIEPASKVPSAAAVITAFVPKVILSASIVISPELANEAAVRWADALSASETRLLEMVTLSDSVIELSACKVSEPALQLVLLSPEPPADVALRNKSADTIKSSGSIRIAPSVPLLADAES